MFVIGPIGLAEPLVLLGLLALPLLWFLLRNLPPPARMQDFPPVALLGGLRDKETETNSIPLWLRLVRLAALAIAIIAFADPIDVANAPMVEQSDNPALLVVDGSWAGAPGWETRQTAVQQTLDSLRRAGTPVFVLLASDPPDSFEGFGDAAAWSDRLPVLSPNPWLPDGERAGIFINSHIEGPFDTWWFSDGVSYPGHDRLAGLLLDRGTVTVLKPSEPVVALGTPDAAGGSITVPVAALMLEEPVAIPVQAVGNVPAGGRGILAASEVSLSPATNEAVAEFRLPLQLRNRIFGFEVASSNSAGSVVLVADSISQRRVGLVTGRRAEEAGALLSSIHYLKRAVEQFAELVQGSLNEVLQQKPDVVVIADGVPVPITELQELRSWVEQGGLLIRFAGAQLAAQSDSTAAADDLYPVRLRPGSRVLGGSMSWDEPKPLSEFPADSPFAGLRGAGDVTVTRQVLAQPGPMLSERTLARLEDGTPLVTARGFEAGLVVLFHVSANAEWSTLPLSGLFPQMLERLAMSAGASSRMAETMNTGAPWVPTGYIDAFGVLGNADGAPAVSGDLMEEGKASSRLPPGIYQSGGRMAAINAVSDPTMLAEASWPPEATVLSVSAGHTTAFKGPLLALALLLFLLEAIATVRIGGRLVSQSLAALALVFLILPSSGEAELTDEQAVEAVQNTVLAYMVTGDSRLDAVSRAGLRGLSRMLELRTTVRPADPIGVDPESGAIAMFPLIYWPVSPVGPELSEEAVRNLINYLRTGGMILFDTRDAIVGGYSSASSNADRLVEIAGPLGLPPLGLPSLGHTLTRSYYLIEQFPGRYAGNIWVEQSGPPEAAAALQEAAKGVDGVTPVVIGGNDWASAWAMNEDGTAMFAVGAGEAGVWQRELAYRFGINLVMHALTGNYKLDQVHVDALVRKLEE